ncbi:hypothetical protein QTP88_020411 [Uroleucon formosanum]
MEQYHRNLINNSMSDLIYVTSDIETIVENLLEKNVINEWMKNYILEDEGESIKKSKFYKLIQGRGPKAFIALCRVLEETNNIKACNILTLSTSEKEEQKLSSIELLDTMSFKNSISEHDKSYVKIHPDRKFIENNLQSGHSVYPMRSNPKGHALILNINNIKDKDKLRGLAVDMANVNKLFKCLGYIIHSKADLNEKEIKNVINEFMNICNSEKANSIVVFIICHGVTGKDSTRSSGLLTEDGITMNTDWMIEQFIHKKLSGNTPMLFFIDACRGPNRDFGWKYCNGENNYLENYDADKYPIGTISGKRYEDVFIAYATLPGHTTICDPIDGSWFIQKLCQVFRENAYNTDLTRMMSLVDIKLDELSNVDHRSQTAEWSFRGFKKIFYFNPGLYEDNPDNILMTSSTNPTDV